MDTTPRLDTSAPLLRAAWAAIVANVAIIVTGGTVRVTASGLGCPEWPTCDNAEVLPAPGAEAGWHQAVEFGNRLMTFVVLAVAIWVVLAARKHAADRRDVRRLAWAQPLGVVAQAVLGGITVLTGLHPLIVGAHLLLSMALVAFAVLLHDRVAPARTVGVSDPPLRRLLVALVVLGAVVLALGTIVTAAGPHAGDPGTARLGVPVREVTRLHSGAVWLTVLTTVAALVRSRGIGAVASSRALVVLIAVEVAQGLVGYVQYALGVPAWLVILHLLGASLFWIAVLRAALTARAPVTSDATIVTPRLAHAE